MAATTPGNIYINNFSISNDGLLLDVHVETDPGGIINSLKLWTDSTFKDYLQAINLTSLLTSTTNVEIFSITAADAGVTNFFDGIFFAEFGATDVGVSNSCNDCDQPLGVAAKLISSKICLLEKVLALDVCSSGCTKGCDCMDTCDIITLDNYIDAMSIAIQFGFYTEAITLLNGIRTLCTTCSECLDLDGMTSNTGLGYYTLNNTLVLQ